MARTTTSRASDDAKTKEQPEPAAKEKEAASSADQKEAQAASPANNYMPPVHHIVRTLITGNPQQGGAPGQQRPVGVDELDTVVGSWLLNGYVLAHSQVLGVGDLGGSFITRILYIMVKREYAAMFALLPETAGLNGSSK